MSERRSVFINVFVLILVQNGILAVLASRLSPNWTAVMTIALAAGVIVLSMAMAMMATRIAGLNATSRVSVTMPAANRSEHPGLRNIDLTDRPQPAPASIPASINGRRPNSAPILLKLEKSGSDNHLQRLQAAEDALNVLDAGLRRIAAGDLGARCETPFADTFEGLRCDFNRALDALDESVSEITLSASALHGECAEARLRVMQERQTGAGELPQLSAAANGLKDIGDALKQHEAALAEIAIITSMVKQHHDDERNAAGTASHAAAALSDTSSAAAAAAAAMRDVAFRTNMLSVNINIAAAKSEPAQDMLRSFAMDLRSIAEDGATAARNISLLERDIAGSATAVRSSFDEIARKDKNIDASLAEAESKLSEIREATGTFSDLVTRTGTIIEGSAKTSGRRKDLDHVLDTILARMAQEVALINRHCGRFIPVTLLRENAPPPESLQPRRRDHLRLIKS